MKKNTDEKYIKLDDKSLGDFTVFTNFYKQQSKTMKNSDEIIDKMQCELPSLLDEHTVLLSARNPTTSEVEVYYVTNNTRFHKALLSEPQSTNHITIYDASRRMHIELSFSDIIDYVPEQLSVVCGVSE